MAQMWQYVIFLSLKPTKVTSDFILYYIVEKNCRGCHHSEILKTNTKTLIYSIWIRPQGSLGCQKVRQGPLNMLFEVWCANIAPQNEEDSKYSQKTRVSFTFFFNFDGFLKFVPFWGIISAKTQQFYL